MCIICVYIYFYIYTFYRCFAIIVNDITISQLTWETKNKQTQPNQTINTTVPTVAISIWVLAVATTQRLSRNRIFIPYSYNFLFKTTKLNWTVSLTSFHKLLLLECVSSEHNHAKLFKQDICLEERPDTMIILYIQIRDYLGC